jgi:hypothetical protein
MNELQLLLDLPIVATLKLLIVTYLLLGLAAEDNLLQVTPQQGKKPY